MTHILNIPEMPAVSRKFLSGNYCCDVTYHNYYIESFRILSLDMSFDSLNRRRILKTTTGLAGGMVLAGCLGDDGDDDDADDTAPADDSDADDSDDVSDEPIGNWPPEDDVAVFGCNSPVSGVHAEDGTHQEMAFQLAIDHLNNGGGWVDEWEELSGDGVVGYEIEGTTSDSAGDPDTSRENFSGMIERDNVQMLTGGVSSAVAETLQPIAQQERVPYMMSIVHSLLTTGEDCQRYSIRTNINAKLTAQALSSYLSDEHGEGLEYFQIYWDYSFGHSNRDAMEEYLDAVGWTQAGSYPMPFGESDHSVAISAVEEEDPDAIIFTSWGSNMADGLLQMRDAGLTDDTVIVAPYISRASLAPASDVLEGVIGTNGWNPLLEDEWSQLFVSAFEDEYDETPGYAAHQIYNNVLTYAAAAERAGTLRPPEVIRELEGHEWENSGIGPAKILECNGQTMRQVVINEGLSPAEQEEQGHFLDPIHLASWPDEVGYDCDEEPASLCDLPELE